MLLVTIIHSALNTANFNAIDPSGTAHHSTYYHSNIKYQYQHSMPPASRAIKSFSRYYVHVIGEELMAQRHR